MPGLLAKLDVISERSKLPFGQLTEKQYWELCVNLGIPCSFTPITNERLKDAKSGYVAGLAEHARWKHAVFISPKGVK